MQLEAWYLDKQSVSRTFIFEVHFSFLLHYHVGPEFIQRLNHWPILITEHLLVHGHFWVLRNLVTLLTKYHHMVLFVSMIGIEKPLRICVVTLAQNAYITLKMLTLNLNTNDYMAWKFWLLYTYTWPFANPQGPLQTIIHCKRAWISDRGFLTMSMKGMWVSYRASFSMV